MAGTIKKQYFASGADVTAPADVAGTSAYTSPSDSQSYTIACSVAASALTISLKNSAGNDPTGPAPVPISFRNTTLATGDYEVVQAIAATSLVISSGSTLGQTSGAAATIFVYAINNAGTIELAASGTPFDEKVTQTTTAEGGAGAADSATVLYSTTARTSKAIRLIAILYNTQTTAGTWAAVPTQINLISAYGRLGMRVSSGSISTTAVSNTTYVDVTGASITLTPGRWMIFANGLLRIDVSGGGVIALGIYDSADNFIGGNAGYKGADASRMAFSSFTYANIYANTTYKLRIASSGASSSFEVAGQTAANDSANAFFAVLVGE